MTQNRRLDTNDFESLFINDTPILDLRAPVEFSQGAFPSAENLPLMSDEERKKVGICYKKYGQDAAIKLGNALVADELRRIRMSAWKTFIQQHPQGFLYCFRGGLRSATVQQWLAAEGIQYPLIKGGYKAMRRFLIESLEMLAQTFDFIVIGGRTGTRKTDLIKVTPNAVDLEGRANHRGSSFGRRVGGQPSVINFENNIAIDILKLKHHYSTIFLEDEGATIGCCSVPAPLRTQIKSSPLFLVEASVDERVENILNDYVLTLSKDYIAQDPDNGWQHYFDAMLASLERIKKRLGGARYLKLKQLMENALNAEQISSNQDLHRDWIKLLLVEYYDPMYDFQIAKKQQRVTAIGNWKEIDQKIRSIQPLS